MRPPSTFWELLPLCEPARSVLSLPWDRFNELPLGAWIGLASLILALLAVGAATLDRLVCAVLPEPAPTSPGRDGGWFKGAVLLLALILPLGVTVLGALAAIMGAKDWRREAAYLASGSSCLLLLAAWLASPYFPLPALGQSFYLTAFLGLVFAILQVWATVKLLRAYWGEPEASVPLYPPLAWWIQLAMLGVSFYWILA